MTNEFYPHISKGLEPPIDPPEELTEEEEEELERMREDMEDLAYEEYRDRQMGL